MTEYEPMLIEILVEVMEPTYVCSVSSKRVLGGMQPGVMCGPWARGSGMGREKAKKLENQATTTW